MATVKWDDFVSVNFNSTKIATPINIVLGIILLSILWFVSGVFIKAPPASLSLVKKPLFKVEVTPSSVSSVMKEVIARGSVMAFKSVSLFSEGSGFIEEIVAPKGSKVKKGDVLLRIRNEDQAQKLQQAKTAVAQREIEYKAALELHHKAFSSEVSLAQAKTDLDNAIANLATAQQNFDQLFIKAPFDGIFNATDLDVGSATVSLLAFGGALGTMLDLSSIKVILQIPEKDSFSLKIGQEAFLSTPYGEKNEILQGKISYISQAADPKLRTFRVEVIAQNPYMKFYEGMTIQARIPIQKAQAHLVNFSLLTLDDSGNVGMRVVDEKSEVKFYPVIPLKTENGKIWVEGLPAKSNIISMGQDFVNTGQKVIAVTKEAK